MTGLSNIDGSDHPAAVAWTQFSSGQRLSTNVEVLKETRNEVNHLIHGVYRLKFENGTNTDSVVAKRSTIEKARKEWMVYKKILSQISVRSPDCFGIQEADDDQHAWLFLEDAGSGAFQSKNEDHQMLKGRWLGSFHVGASQLSGSIDLINRGPADRRDCMTLVMDKIRVCLEKSDHSPVYDQSFRDVLAIGSQILSSWAEIEDTCQELPWTVLHGDLVPKNMAVQTKGSELVLMVFDWQTASWAPPSADLAPGYWNNTGVKFLRSYLSTVAESWPSVDINTIRRLARVGSLFRMIDAIEWDLSWLDQWQPDALDDRMRTYRKRLQKFVSAA